MDPLDHPEEELAIGLLLVTSKFLRRLDRVCKDFGITDDQYTVLRILRAAGSKGLPRFAIAGRLLSRAPDVTRLLDRLETKGLVRRTRAEPDRRQSISTITREGIELLHRMSEDVRQASLEVTEPLSAAEKKDLRRLLARLMRGEEGKD